MTSIDSPEAPPMQPATPELDAFFEQVRAANPFDVNRVGQAARAEADAPLIHDAAFTRLIDLVARAGRQSLAIGAMLWGEAGVGKSHLLARLVRWAGADPKKAIVVPLSNLQAAPPQLPRSLLRCVISILTRGRVSGFAETPLYRLMNVTMRKALHYNGRSRSWREAETAYQSLIDNLCDRAPGQAAFVDRRVYSVLFSFFRSAYEARTGRDDGVAALAVRWLSGDPLDAGEARALGLPAGAGPDQTISLTDDQQVRNVLVALAQAASYRGVPLVLCCDQADTLEAEQFGALARFLHGVLDTASNLLVVTCGLRTTLQQWLTDGVIQDSTWQRLTQYEIMLQRVSAPEARQIVQARLQPFQELFLTQEPIKELVNHDLLFPLGERWAAEFLGDRTDIRPRDVINWAREGWRREQEALARLGGPEWLQQWNGRTPSPPPGPDLTPEEIEARIDQAVDLKLAELRARRQQEPHTLPPDADNLAGLLVTLLERCLNAPAYPSLLAVDPVPRPRQGPPPPCDLILRQRLDPEGLVVRTGILCLVVSSRISMSGYLRRLVQDTQPLERLFLITDERRPFDPGPAGQEYLEQLRGRYNDRFLHVVLTFEQYAELDALQEVVGLARAGDLEIELPGGQARRVSEQEVLASHFRRQRYRAQPLLRLLLEPEPAAPAPQPDAVAPPPSNGLVPDEKDTREFIMGRLAITMGTSSRELAVQFQDYLRHRQVDQALTECKAWLEEVARKMHAEGLVHATPFDDNLSLMRK